MISNCIRTLMVKDDLTTSQLEQTLRTILRDDANPLQIAAFLALLRAKPETSDELATMVHILRREMIPVATPHKVLDIVGTGGDGFNTVNLSTGSAILAASCGVKVAKHGNRAASSLAGSADVLEALGVNINLTPKKISECINAIGIGFCFAPNFHPTTSRLSSLRKQIGVPTTFNLLGPLLNPARPSYLMLGVYDEKLMPILAKALLHIGIERAIIMHGGGLDELSCLGSTKLLDVSQIGITSSVIDPASLGLPICQLSELVGGDAHKNARMLLNTFAGKPSALANTLILNAAVALYLSGNESSIHDALAHARECLYSGSALTLLKQWIEFSHDNT